MRYRLDFDLASTGVAVSALDDPDDRQVRVAPTAQTGIRVAFPTGDGFFADVGFMGIRFAYVLHETGYLRRFYFSGSDYGGLALELQGGLSIGALAGESSSYGAISGGNVAISVDGRNRHFIMGIMIRYRVLYDGTTVHHVPSAILRITFGSWGD